MYKIAFAGFGGANTPREIIIGKCAEAESELASYGTELCSAFPVIGDKGEDGFDEAVEKLKAADPATLVLCVAGWIPTYIPVRLAENFRHLPVIIWGLCGRSDQGRLLTTAGTAGAVALRGALDELGYRLKVVYDSPDCASKAGKVAEYCATACAARELRSSKVGMMGYRDMNLYGTMFDGISMKRVTGVEIECFEMLEMAQRYAGISAERKQEIIDNHMKSWDFMVIPEPTVISKTVGYYLALSDIAREKGYKAVSVKDTDGMNALLGFPPAPVMMLLSDIDGVSTVPANDAPGCVTQLIIRAATGQCGAYLELFEFMENSVLAGARDYIPAEITEGKTRVMSASFGGGAQGLVNISDIRTGTLTLCRLICSGGSYRMHIAVGEGKRASKWEEYGWSKPAPSLPALEIELDDVEEFADKAAAQHYFISYGDNAGRIGALCDLLGIEII